MLSPWNNETFSRNWGGKIREHFLSKHKYIVDLGKETSMFDYKLTSPLDINVKLWKGIESPLVNEESFLR